LIDLLLSLWCQDKRQASGIPAGTHHARGVIGHAGGVQEGQFTALKMGLAAVRVQEQGLTMARQR
jgi:hypothetical protein